MTEDRKPHLAVVAPIFPVTNLRQSVAYYTEKLLFSIGFEWSDSDKEPVRYAIIQNGDTELHLTQSEKPHKAGAYFFLHGVQEYYDAVKKNGADITQEIADQPWEMREFEVADPDGNMLIFGEHFSRISPDG